VLDTKGGKGVSMLDLGERVNGLILLCVILHAFTFTFMHCDICVIVRLMWHVCSLY
jgi:hypothetical protein